MIQPYEYNYVKQQITKLIDIYKTVDDKQIEKSFKKVKGLKFLSVENYDLKETNYLAWDDIGTQRRYINFYKDDRLVGFYGIMSIQVIKNVCSICRQIDNVSMFMAKTKSSGDGTYTKKGTIFVKTV